MVSGPIKVYMISIWSLSLTCYIRAVIAQHCENYKSHHSNLTDKLSHSLYVDDLITGEETIQRALWAGPASQTSDV